MKVFVTVIPGIQRENSARVVQVKNKQIILRDPHQGSKEEDHGEEFEFDHCFQAVTENDAEDEILKELGKEIQKNISQGCNSCICAVGQRVSGEPLSEMGKLQGLASEICKGLFTDFVGEKCKVVMIASISPTAECYRETIATLTYINTAKNLSEQWDTESHDRNEELSLEQRGERRNQQARVFFIDKNMNSSFMEDLMSNMAEEGHRPSLLKLYDDHWKLAAEMASTIIFCHFGTSEEAIELLFPYLEHVISTHDPSKIKVILTDVEDPKKVQAWWDQRPFSKCKLECIRKEDGTRQDHTDKEMKGTMSLKKQQPKPQIVGIFSRFAESDYHWLKALLISEFSHLVKDVRPCHISNNGRRQFWEDVSQCTVGILYHTKRSGRLNITDVQDSLYDEELEYMSTELGKEKVIVLADDLNNSSPEEKSRILMNQPKIGIYAWDLVILTPKEKENKMMTMGKMKSLECILQGKRVLPS
uniref:Kinesin motor domain-containing protein n=1 Tax=Xenopus tropicalis TaxID=8364 RepID=A0A803JTQ2_XENTR